MDSHYELLGLLPTTSTDDIRAAYLSLAKTTHPDRVPPHEREEAAREFKRLAEAYEVLSNPHRRKAYDASLRPPRLPPPSDPSSARSAGALVPFSSTHALHSRRPLSPSSMGSPFPGYRVPPGGYPHDRPPAVAPWAAGEKNGRWEGTVRGRPYGHGEEQDRPEVGRGYSASFPPQHQGRGKAPFCPPPPPPPPPLKRAPYPPDPFPAWSDFQSTLPHPSSPPPPPHPPPFSHPFRPLGPTRKSSTTWSDDQRHRNGDWSHSQGREDVEEDVGGEGGGRRVRRMETVVSFSSGAPPFQHHHPSPHRRSSFSAPPPFDRPFPPHHHPPPHQHHHHRPSEPIEDEHRRLLLDEEREVFRPPAPPSRGLLQPLPPHRIAHRPPSPSPSPFPRLHPPYLPPPHRRPPSPSFSAPIPTLPPPPPSSALARRPPSPVHGGALPPLARGREVGFARPPSPAGRRGGGTGGGGGGESPLFGTGEGRRRIGFEGGGGPGEGGGVLMRRRSFGGY